MAASAHNDRHDDRHDDREVLTRLLGSAGGLLLDTYGSTAGIFAAAPELLARQAGAEAAERIADLRTVCLSLLRAEVERAPACSPGIAARYAQARLARLPREELLVLFLDTTGRLIQDEILAIGTVDRMTVHTREILRRTLEIGARSILIAHNHPGGQLAPSETDVASTRELAGAARLVGVHLLDHLLVTRSGWTSLRNMGLL